MNSKQANSWTLRLLLTQLYDPAVDVRELAVNFLEEACESRELLQMVVEMQPTLDHLGELGHPLLLKYVCSNTLYEVTDLLVDSCQQLLGSIIFTKLSI